MSRAGIVVALLLALAASGCAGTRSTRVGAEMILPPLAPQMKLQQREQFFMARHLNPELLPDYPAALLADGPAQAVVCVEIVVDEGGEVAWQAPLHAAPRCPPGPVAALAPFEQAALDAVARWQFIAAAVCTYPEGVERNDDCRGEGVVEKAVPLRMAFVFEFDRSEKRGRFSATGR